MAFLTCELKSEFLRMDTTVSLILPQDIHRSEACPSVLYLLHGCPHNHSVWQRYTSLERYAQDMNLAIIMPEANRSFYTDMKYGVQYFSYLSKELPSLCERMFGISSEPSRRYIGGLSMGGYGSLKIFLSCPGSFGACFAMSPLCDIRIHIRRTKDTDPKWKDFCGVFGPELNPKDTDDLYFLAKTDFDSAKPPIFLYCGLQDGMYPEAADFVSYLKSLHYPVDAQFWDGRHDWDFWDVSIQRVLKTIRQMENAQK